MNQYMQVLAILQTYYSSPKLMEYKAGMLFLSLNHKKVLLINVSCLQKPLSKAKTNRTVLQQPMTTLVKGYLRAIYFGNKKENSGYKVHNNTNLEPMDWVKMIFLEKVR